MEYTLLDPNTTSLDTVLINHGRETVTFSVSVFGRTKLEKSNEYFNNLNGFIKYLPMSKQDHLFNYIKQLKDTLNEVADPTRVHLKLKKIVFEIYELIEFKEILEWFRFNGRVNYPPELKSQLVGDTNNLTTQLTYLLDDYYELVVFGTYLKIIMPLFGEYLAFTHSNSGSKFRDRHTASLIAAPSILNLPVYKRLEVYVEASLEKETRRSGNFSATSSVFGGLGIDELPLWLLSKVLVRRLAVFNEATADNLVANIYHTITSQLTSLDKTFGRITDKRNPTGGSLEEDNVSIAENYKVKQTTSDGDLATLGVYVNSIVETATVVDPTVNPKLVELFTEHLLVNNRSINERHKIVITQWVLARSISPRGIPLLNKTSLLKTIGITQALLWHWGYYDLCALMNATPRTRQENFFTSISKLPKKMVEEFEKIYPYYKSQGASTNVRKSNFAIRGIDLVGEDLSINDWDISLPNQLQSLVPITKENQHLFAHTEFVLPIDIKIKLGDLLLRLNNKI